MHVRAAAVLAVLVLAWLGTQEASAGACSALGDCNGHGTCDSSTLKCTCFEGWGASTDVTYYRAPDCSKRTCPADKAWVDAATADNTAHALAECSNRGLCDRSTGKCSCFSGYEGDACQRTACPNQCSGHGKCVSLKNMAGEIRAFPINFNNYTYGEPASLATWDADKIYGCVCDSSWTVGLDTGETQAPTWFGADCSLKHCPSGDDPMTDAVETDCAHKKWNGAASGEAATGNLCHVDCANRGICDHSTGLCRCFDGFRGEACTVIDVLARF